MMYEIECIGDESMLSECKHTISDPVGECSYGKFCL